MTHFKVCVLLASAITFGCAVDGTEAEEDLAAEEAALEEGVADEVPSEADVVALAAKFNAESNAHLTKAGQVQFWCDRVVKDSGTEVDNSNCRNRSWKLIYVTFPCGTYHMEYGPWRAGC